MSFLYILSPGQENETLPYRRLAIQPKTKAVEAYYSEFLGLQKDRIAKQMLPIAEENFYFLNFNHSLVVFCANKIVE